ncbi:MAG: hypothetical protein LBJ83_01195 [Oscillospiraceae bacterium]|jgi:hypothetical protein|nr:hypothetical protein [Oscillospiraceae bacterium]
MKKIGKRVSVIFCGLFLVIGSLNCNVFAGPPESPVELYDFLGRSCHRVAQAIYGWGGGWDPNGGVETTQLIDPVSPERQAFYQQNASATVGMQYTFGLRAQCMDCSGLTANICRSTWPQSDWGQILGPQRMGSHRIGPSLEADGWGQVCPHGTAAPAPGDLAFTETAGHIAIVVACCSDGSVVLLESTPPRIALRGTPSTSGRRASEAAALSEEFMARYHPGDCEQFRGWETQTLWLVNNPWMDDHPQVRDTLSLFCHHKAINEYALFKFNQRVVTDRTGLRRMDPREVMERVVTWWAAQRGEALDH